MSIAPGWLFPDRMCARAVLLVALGLLTLSSRAAADTDRLIAAADCVTVSPAKLNVQYSFRYTNSAGTISASTIEFLAISDTSVRLRSTQVDRSGATETVSETTQRVVDDLVVTDRVVSTGVNPSGSFRNTVTYQPGLVGDPTPRVCSGRTWTIPAVTVSTAASSGRSSETKTDSGSGRVVSVSESVTVPAGTFLTVHYEKTFTTASGRAVQDVWQSITAGGPVKYTYSGPGVEATQVLTGSQ